MQYQSKDRFTVQPEIVQKKYFESLPVYRRSSIMAVGGGFSAKAMLGEEHSPALREVSDRLEAVSTWIAAIWQLVDEMSAKLDTLMEHHRTEIKAMQTSNQQLLASVERVVEQVASEETSTMVIRSLTLEEAKKEVLDLLRSQKGPLHYSDIAEDLQMDLNQLLEVTTALEEEGLIGEPESHG